MNFRNALCISLLLIAQLFSTPLAHAAQEPTTPDGVAQRFLEARQRLDWTSALEYVDPEHIKALHPYSLKMFEDDGNNRNIFRKFFLGPEINAGAVRTLPSIALVGSYLDLKELTRSGRQGLTEMISFKLLNTFLESPDLAHILVRENVRYWGIESKTIGVVQLKRSGQRWFVLIDEELALSRAVTAMAGQMLSNTPYRTVSLDLRAMSPGQQIVAVKKAMTLLVADRWLKYEFVVGTNSDLQAELHQMATVFSVNFRIGFTEKPAATSRRL